MKILVVDASGEEHDLSAVIFGIACDLHRMNKRITDIELELGLVEPQELEGQEDGTEGTE